MNYLAGSANSPIPYPENYPKDVIAGHGPFVVDANGQEYIDLWMGYGALLFGHADEEIKKSVTERLNSGWFFSYPTKMEKDLAMTLHDIVPCAERVRFGTTGSDAVAYAIRASRSFTGRQKVLVIDGGYHGVHENMISRAGSISQAVHDKVPFSDVEAITGKLLTGEYACVILEPILANNGCVPPADGYLAAVRKACDDSKTVLVFDEVVVGFRTALGGAQSYFEITPDICTFSKAIAGGFPLSVVCGKQAVLEQYAPTGPVFFAGTFNGSPVSLAAAEHIIRRLKDNPPYDELNELRQKITTELTAHAKSLGLPFAIQGIGSMMSLAFGCDTFPQGAVAAGANAEMYEKFASHLASSEKILLPPMFTETIFLSPVHVAEEAKIISSLKSCMTWLKEQ